MAEADFTSILSSKPKRQTLNKYHDLHKKWYLLGLELEIDDEDMDNIEDKYSDDSMRINGQDISRLVGERGKPYLLAGPYSRHWWTLIRKILPSQYAQI